jgi:pimeloyl-ACP methyl ester carboxylesterase
MSARRHAAREPSADPGWTHRSVRVGDHQVHVRISDPVPAATPIVHVHGFAISGTYLMPTARRLAARAPNVVPDLPGYGGSESWGATLGIPALAEALLALLDALGLDRVVIVGNSMGCPVALEVAHVAPERVERIVLASPAGGMYNQPLSRGLVQLARDGRREDVTMARVAVPDYLRFGRRTRSGCSASWCATRRSSGCCGCPCRGSG